MTVQILARFCGPPDSGNGGYVAGLMAEALGGSGVEVTLHAPPPLNVALELAVEGGEARLSRGEAQIASARRHELSIEVPPAIELAAAAAAEAHYAGLTHHLFPGCFVCGPEREAGDGLRIFPGAVREGLVASAWQPDAALGDDQGRIEPRYLWSALDCPGYWAVREKAGMALLGRIAATVYRWPSAGEALVVSGWAIASEGRKHLVGTAIHDADGTLVAAARATWISLRS